VCANFRWEVFSYFIPVGRPKIPSRDGRTELPWLIERSALQAMRPRCKNQVTVDAVHHSNIPVVKNQVT